MRDLLPELFWRVVRKSAGVAACLSAFLAASHGLAADPWTWVSLPDTQNYSEFYPETYNAQTQWIVDNAAALNIKFVTHLGDLVNHHNAAAEWANAKAAMSILDNANMPYGIAYGNHDIHYGVSGGTPNVDYDPNATNYLANFGPQYYADKSWYGGASPSGQSNYEVITYAPGKDMIFLHLSVETPPAELAWAQGVINANRDKPVHVSTHRYMQDYKEYSGGIGIPGIDPGRFPDIWYQIAEPLYRDDGIESNVFFNSFVKPNKNIFMVECGHFHAEYNQTSTNNYGLPVQEILVDYQDDPNGGNGYLRTMTVNTDNDTIAVKSYSPTLHSYQTDAESQFTLHVDLDQYTYAAGSTAVKFQNGVSGYNGTQDTYVSEANKGSSYGASNIVIVDDDINNNLFNDKEAQGLIRFDNLFQAPVYEGDAAPTRIPTDATITKGDLIFNVTDDIDLGTVTYNVNVMNINWNESSTWDSLSGGIRDNLGVKLGEFTGDNDPNGLTVRNINVIAALNAWKNGTPNYGIAITDNTPSGIDDGIEIASSEDGNVSLRPSLDVEYTYTVHNRAPTVTQMLTASSLVIDEGQSIELFLAALDANPLDPLVFTINGTDVAFAVGSGSASAPCNFYDNGTATFSATVTDDEDTVSAGSVSITVRNVAPTITQVSQDPVTVAPGAVMHMSMHGSATDPGIYDTLTYQWDINNDGIYGDLTGADATATLHAGRHTMGLKVTDDDGGFTTRSVTVTAPSAAALSTDFDGPTLGTVIVRAQNGSYFSQILDIPDSTYGCVAVDALTDWPADRILGDHIFALLWLSGAPADWVAISDDLNQLPGVHAYLNGDQQLEWNNFASAYGQEEMFSMLIEFYPVNAPNPYADGIFYFGWDFDGVAVQQLAIVPEPATVALFATGLALIARSRRRLVA